MMESINTTQVKAQGLEAPETFFVDENAFEKHFGRKITDEELVTEEFNGVKMRGVTCFVLYDICVFFVYFDALLVITSCLLDAVSVSHKLRPTSLLVGLDGSSALTKTRMKSIGWPI